MQDEPSEPRVLATLMREAVVPPSRITPQEAVRLGRRSVSLRRSLVVGTAATAVLAVAGAVNLRLDDDRPPVVVPPSTVASPSPSRPPGWVPARLANPPGVGNRVRAEAVDPSGRFVLGNAGGRIVLWDNATPALLPEPEPDLLENSATDVNSSGTVIGTAGRKDGSYYAWIYRGGTYTKLAKPQGARRYHAANINDRGDILGSSDGVRVLFWPATAPGTVKVLPAIDSAGDLDDDGTIGCNVGDGGHPCVVAPDGTQRKLAGGPEGPRGKVFALRGEWAGGWVLNTSNDSNLMAARWNLRTGELTYYPELSRPVEAVSATGAVLSGAGGPPEPRPVVVSPEGLRHPLDSTMPGSDDWLVGASDMSRDGTIVVGYETNRVEIHPLVWRFVPGAG